MAEQEVKTILTVDTNAAVTSLKDYKKQIEDIQVAMLRLDKESEEYARLSEELRDKQNRLNEVLKNTGKAVQAAEGSYRALSEEMSALKKQWKETGDAVERAKIGEKIQVINDRLKEMDYSIGNYQRNVGNYSSAFQNALQSVGRTGESFSKVINGINASIALLGLTTNSTNKTFQALGKAVQVIQMLGGIGSLVTSLKEAGYNALNLLNRITGIKDAWNSVKGKLSISGNASINVSGSGGNSVANAALNTQKQITDEMGKQQVIANNNSNIVTAALPAYEKVKKSLRDQSKILEKNALDWAHSTNEVNNLSKTIKDLDKAKDRYLATGDMESYLKVIGGVDELFKKYGTNNPEEIIQKVTDAYDAAERVFKENNKKLQDNIIKAFKDGLPIEDIAKASKKSVDEVKKMIKDNLSTDEILETVEKSNEAVEEMVPPLQKVKGLIKSIGFSMGIAAVIAGISFLIQKIAQAVQKIKAAREEAIKLKKEMLELDNAAAKDLVTFEALRRSFTQATDKESWINENASALESMGIYLKDVNDAEDVFVTNTDKYIEGIKARAKATAALALAQKTYEEYLSKKADTEARISQNEQDIAKYEAEISNFNAPGPESGIYLMTFSRKIDKIKKENKELADSIVELGDKTNEKVNSLIDLSLEAQSAAKDALKGVSKEVKDAYEKAKTPEVKVEIDKAAELRQKEEDEELKRLKQIQEELRKGSMSRVQLLTDEYNIRKALFEKYAADTTLLDKKFQNDLLAIQNEANTKQRDVMFNEYEKKKLAVNNEYDALIALVKEKYEALKAEGKDISGLSGVLADIEKARANALQGLFDEEILSKLRTGQSDVIATTSHKVNIADKSILNERDKQRQIFDIQEDGINERLSLLKTAKENELLLSDAAKAELIKNEEELTAESNSLVKERSNFKKKCYQEDIRNYSQAAQSIASIFDSVAQINEDELNARYKRGEITEEQAKKEFENNKAWQYSSTWINTLAGMTAALTSPILNSTPAGWVAAAAQAASLLAAGVASTIKIKNTEFGGGGTDTGGITSIVPVTPTLNTLNDLSVSSDLAIADKTIESQQDTKVYILESDIEKSNKRVEVRDRNTNFE